MERKRESELQAAEPDQGSGGPHERTDEEVACTAYPLEEPLLKWVRHASNMTQVQQSCAVAPFQVSQPGPFFSPSCFSVTLASVDALRSASGMRSSHSSGVALFVKSLSDLSGR